MGDNNNKKDELPYQIPGVIIPEQVTDSGKVVGTSDTKDTLNDIKKLWNKFIIPEQSLSQIS